MANNSDKIAMPIIKNGRLFLHDDINMSAKNFIIEFDEPITLKTLLENLNHEVEKKNELPDGKVTALEGELTWEE